MHFLGCIKITGVQRCERNEKMGNITYIMKKELTRVFSDRKIVFSLFILPAVLMFGVYMLMGNAFEKMMTDVKEHVPTVFIQNPPKGLKEVIKTTGFLGNIVYVTNDTFKVIIEEEEVTKHIIDIKEGILQGDIELLVSFEENFLEKIETYQDKNGNPEVKTYYNPSEDYSVQARQTFLEQVLNQYKQQLLAERIGDLNRLTVFDVDLNINTSKIQKEEKANGKVFAMMLPYLIVMLLFTGPMSLGVDSITGEKERGTMASILITPIKRSEIVMGKLIALSILSCLSALVYASSMIISIPKMFQGMSGDGAATSVSAATASFSIIQVVELIVIMVVLVFFYVAIVSLISVFARTTKEASTYISPIYFIITIAGVLTMFAGNQEIPLALFGIPVYGGAISIQKIMIHELTMAQFGINVVVTCFITFIIVIWIAKTFDNEKVMFNA